MQTGFHTFKRQAATATFPRDFSHYVTSFGEVYFWPLGNFHVVTRAKHAILALRDQALSCDRSSFFVSRMPNMDLSLIQDFFAVVAKMMVMSDGQDHKQRRAIAAKGFTDALIEAYAHQIPHHIEALIKARLTADGIDFARDLASRLPSIILADLFRIPEADRELFYQRSNQMTGFFGGGSGYENEDGQRVNQAAIGLREYFVDLLKERRTQPTDDFFSKMIQAAARFGLDDMEIIAQGIMMLVAGQVTTSDQMNNIMFQLLQNPDLLAAVQSDHALIPVMVEELTRLDPAVTFIFRVAKSDTMIGGQKIARGDVVFISTHAINRDPELFANPDQIDLARGETKHFAYGYGAHHCLGAKLARVEINAVFRYLLTSYAKLEFGPGEPHRDHYSLSFSGFKSLPLRLA